MSFFIVRVHLYRNFHDKYLKKSQQPMNNQRKKRLLWSYLNEMKLSMLKPKEKLKFPKSENREKTTISSLHLLRILWGTFSYIILIVYGNRKTSIWRTHSLNSFFLCLRRTFFSEICKKKLFVVLIFVVVFNVVILFAWFLIHSQTKVIKLILWFIIICRIFLSVGFIVNFN